MDDNKTEYNIPSENLTELGQLSMKGLADIRNVTHDAVSRLKIPHSDVGAIVIPFIVMPDQLRVYTFLGSTTDLQQVCMLLKLEVKRLEDHLAKLSAEADG